MESDVQKIKTQISVVSRNIHKSVAATFGNSFVQDMVHNAVGDRDQNKASFLHFLNTRTDEILNPPEGLVPAKTVSSQLYALKKIDKFIQKTGGGKIEKDYFDLEKSFMAYRYSLLAESYRLAPLGRVSYGLFQDVRDTRLGRIDARPFNEEIEPEELQNFRTELDTLLDKANDFVIYEGEDDPKHLKSYMLEKLDEMRGNKDIVFAAAAFANNSKDSKAKRHRAAFAFGYTAFALAHLAEDKHIPFEKRCFLVEQTDRVLHYLALTA